MPSCVDINFAGHHVGSKWGLCDGSVLYGKSVQGSTQSIRFRTGNFLRMAAAIPLHHAIGLGIS